MSNRIRFAVHHGANVHLIPWDQLDAVAVAPVADEARLRVCALGRAVGTLSTVEAGGELKGELCDSDAEVDYSDPKSQTIHDKSTTIHQWRSKSLLFVEV